MAHGAVLRHEGNMDIRGYLLLKRFEDGKGFIQAAWHYKVSDLKP